MEAKFLNLKETPALSEGLNEDGDMMFGTLDISQQLYEVVGGKTVDILEIDSEGDIRIFNTYGTFPKECAEVITSSEAS